MDYISASLISAPPKGRTTFCGEFIVHRENDGDVQTVLPDKEADYSVFFFRGQKQW